jgi:hypothetical protein
MLRRDHEARPRAGEIVVARDAPVSIGVAELVDDVSVDGPLAS